MERQRGAVMVLATLMMGAALIAWQHRASLSQLIMGQQSLDQATSAAALGAAQWHARILNAHALLNRTEMAHQVAMAHLMTMASAWEMRERIGEQARRNNPPASLIGMFFGPGQAFAYRSAMRGGDRMALKDLRDAFESHDRLLAGNLKRARADLRRDLAKRTESLIHEILRRNLGAGLWASPGFSVQVSHPGGLPSRVQRMNNDAKWQGWLDAVVRRHGYLKDRSSFRPAFSPMYPQCPILKHLLVRTGETIVTVNGNWSADDTLAFHSVRPLPKWCYFREYSMGWARVKVTPKSYPSTDVDDGPVIEVPDSFKETTFRKWIMTIPKIIGNGIVPFYNQVAVLRAKNRTVQWQRSTRPVPYQLDPVLSSPVLTVSTKVSVASLGQRTWRVRLALAGLLDAHKPDWPRQLHAQASARVEYDPMRTLLNGPPEPPSLLQAFWDARQVPVPESEVQRSDLQKPTVWK